MATPLTLYFDSDESFYNAVYFANAIGDLKPGQYDVTVRYAAGISGGQAGTLKGQSINLSQTYGQTLESSELSAVVDKLIDPAEQEVFKLSAVFANGKIADLSLDARHKDFGSSLFGFTPAIRHDLTLDFEDASDPGKRYVLGTGALEIINLDYTINSVPYDRRYDTLIAYSRSLFKSGIKIDDGNPGTHIDVQIRNLTTASQGGIFLDPRSTAGRNMLQYPDLGVLLDNHENLTVENLQLGPVTVLGSTNSIPEQVLAPVINRSGAQLRMEGLITAAPNFNYRNSLLFNQGNAVMFGATLRAYEKNSPTIIYGLARYGSTRRPEGAIDNVGTLLVRNSQLLQEAGNETSADSLDFDSPLINNTEGRSGRDPSEGPGFLKPTPSWRPDKPFSYLLQNQGATAIEASTTLAGILLQNGAATTLTIKDSHLGYGETPSFENLKVTGGSLEILGSTIDRVSKDGNVKLMRRNNSVVLSSDNAAFLAPNADPAYLKSLDPIKPSLFKPIKDTFVFDPALAHPAEFWHTTYDPSRLDPAVLAAVNATLSGTAAGSSPHITTVAPGFGAALKDAEKSSPQTVDVTTAEVNDGAILQLTLNGRTYSASVSSNAARFTLPPADLATLPTGLATLVVGGTAAGKAIPEQSSTFSVEGPPFAAVPHITAILPGFGTVLSAAELQQAQTVLVTTTGLEAGRPLSLELDGAANAAISGGVVQANGEASFSIPASVLASLDGGLHRLRISGSTTAGVAAPPAELPFSADGAHNTVVTPHVLAIVPSFGAVLSNLEVQSDQTVVVSTDNLSDGDQLQLSLFGKSYTASVSANSASFTLPVADLQALPSGDDFLSVSGPISPVGAIQVPDAQQSFTKDGTTPLQPHVLSITPAFGHVLDVTEAASAQVVTVSTENFGAGGSVTLSLAGKSYSPSTFANGTASFTLPATDLGALATGTVSLAVNGSAAGINAPELLYSFEVDKTTAPPLVPAITSLAPSFGGVLDLSERNSAQTVVVSTRDIADNQSLSLTLNGKSYTATTSGNQASFALPDADLQALAAGLSTLRVTPTGQNTPAAEFTISVEGQTATNMPLLLSIIPAFGHVLDVTEAASAQVVTVSTENFGAGGSVTLSLAGKSYSPSAFTNGVASFSLPAADLGALATGTASLALNGSAAGINAPELLYSFVVDKTTAPPLVPAITSLAPSFGGVLDLSERNSAQSVVVSTRDIPDNQILSLRLNGKIYNANTGGNQASFALPPAALQALPVGLSTLRVTPSGQSTPAAEFTISVEAPELASTPHVLSILPSFGAVLTAAEAQQQQTISVSTEGVEENQRLVVTTSTLLLQGNVNNGRTLFTLSPEQLQALPVGLDSITVAVANRAGVQAPLASLSFAVDGPAPVALPHIDQIVPSFGSLLEASEIGSDQSVAVDTTGFTAGDTLSLGLAGKSYSATTTATGEASFLIPAADLVALQPGLEVLSVNGSTAAGVAAPELQRSFSVDGDRLVPHITDIDPGFGATLDRTEAAVDQTIAVISARLADGQALRLSLNGTTYDATISSNQAQFVVPSAVLQALPSGVDTLRVEAPGSGAPAAEQAFTVLPASSDGGNSGQPDGGGKQRIVGTPNSDELIGSGRRDRIRGLAGPDRLLGRGGADRLSGGRGRDDLQGEDGDDLLIGGRGGDFLRGGLGADTFRFSEVEDSPADRRNHQDVIIDFFANDRIDLSRLAPALSFINAEPFSGSAGELRYASGQLSADLDADRQADFLVMIEGLNAALSPAQLLL